MRKFFRRWQINRTINILNRLDDATLRDIGVPRGMISGHVNDLFAKE